MRVVNLYIHIDLSQIVKESLICKTTLQQIFYNVTNQNNKLRRY